MANYVLEILDGDRAGEVLPVADQPLRIGRKPGNDLVLADEKTSGVHCEIVREGDRHVLRDLGSTNGTFLDGKRVNELVLTPGDVITVGRLRVKFRDRDEAGGGVAASVGDLAVHRLDAARLKKGGGSLGIVAALVLVAAAGGGYFWWQGQSAGEGAASPRIRDPLSVAGNTLPAAVAACEGEEGWSLRVAGVGFQPVGSGHTGRGGFEAVRGEAADAPGFGLATLQEPLKVLSGRTMTVAAHVQTAGGGRFALRATCSSSNEAYPFRFRHGTPVQVADGWQRVEAVVTIPNGCDRLQVELVAVLPQADSLVRVDDVAVLEAGTANGIELDLEDSNQKCFGTGSALAVRSTDVDNPVTLFELQPGDVPADLVPLRDAGYLAFSDVGGKLGVTGDDRSFRIVGDGVAALDLVLPAGSAGDPLALDLQGSPAGSFVSVAAESSFTAAGVLVGSGATRALIRTDGAAEFVGRVGGGVYRLRVAGNAVTLVLGFRSERLSAGDLLRQARAATTPGAALDTIRKLAATVPHDSGTLAQAQQLRAEVLAAQADEVAALRRDLDEAKFFDTRGGFERVAARAAALEERYGRDNLEDAAAVDALRGAAQERLAALDAEFAAGARTRLEQLGRAFAEQQQAGLAKLVQDYVGSRFGGAAGAQKEKQ
ncbi:MAG: hypothetical protein RL398_2360 [Planctomycetota bacterium]|jgi:hypothetical protein